MRRTNKLLLIIVIICILGLIGTYITRTKLFVDSEQPPLYVVVAGGEEGGKTYGLTKSIHDGVERAIVRFEQMAHMPGRKIILQVVEGFDHPDRAIKSAQKIADENKAAVVIGLWSESVLKSVGPIFRQYTIPVISLSSAHIPEEGHRWLFGMAPTLDRQAQFLANYARNVLGHKVITILQDDTPYGRALAENFEKVYNRFGTKIHKKHSFLISDPDLSATLENFAIDIKESRDGSALFLATHFTKAALFIKKLRDHKARNLILGLDTLATNAFRQTLAKLPGQLPSVAHYTNQMLVSLPLLFDTANEAAQQFKNHYTQTYSSKSPDWVAAYAYEASYGLLNALAESWNLGEKGNLFPDRMLISSFLFNATLSSEGRKISIVDGNVFGQGNRVKPILVGRYDGENLVSALIQLHPIQESVQQSGTTNYLEELKQGRMLYVNDRFMYKTNVVNTGFELKEITALDMKSNTFELEFSLWFRYRGTFNPEDIEFVNALEPIHLKEPVETLIKDDLSFKLFTIRGTFSADYLDTKRPYGSHVIGTAFRHKTLNRDNLMFVVDVLGMGMESGKTVQSRVDTPQILNPNQNWKIDRAWISQERVQSSSLGKPAYVGFGTTEPEFSRIDLGMIISKAELSARDFIPYEYFIYMGIFGLIGLIFAIGIDANAQGGFWKTSSWGLRILFWPLFMVSFGNLLLDFAFQNFAIHFVDNLLLGYNILWWLIPAMLTTMALERFLWEPLEQRANRPIPKVVRNIASFSVYLLAIFAITAFVFDQKLTSLLATSGLLTMIIGLAVQANISNIFSGIAVNVERPYSIGDWLKLGDNDDAQLIDITWRTMRLRTREGVTISVPNGMASEMLVINFSDSKEEQIVLMVYVSPDHDPQWINQLLVQAMSQSTRITPKPPKGEFNGIVNIYNRWAALYEAEFWIKDHTYVQEISAEIWELIWRTFRENGVTLSPDKGISSPVFRQRALDNGEGEQQTEEESEPNESDNEMDAETDAEMDAE